MIGWALMTSEWRHFCHFRPKKRFRGRSCQAYSFRDTKNTLDVNDVESKGLQNCLLEFLKFLDFDTQKLKKMNITFKKSFKRSEKIFEFRKTRNICDSPYRLLFTYQIWDRYLFFWPRYNAKLFKIDDVKFSNSIFINSRPRSAKQRSPFDSPWRPESNQYQFYAKLATLKFDLFWPDLDLTSNRKWPEPYLIVL